MDAYFSPHAGERTPGSSLAYASSRHRAQGSAALTAHEQHDQRLQSAALGTVCA